MKSNFSNKLASFIHNSEMTGAVMARRLGISTAYLSDMKLGNRKPTPRFINKIADEFEFVDRTEWMKSGAKTCGWEI